MDLFLHVKVIINQSAAQTTRTLTLRVWTNLSQQFHEEVDKISLQDTKYQVALVANSLLHTDVVAQCFIIGDLSLWTV